MNFDIPQDIQQFLDEVDRFIEREIKPLEESDDNIRFLITVAKMPAPIGIARGSPMKSGRLC